MLNLDDFVLPRYRQKYRQTSRRSFFATIRKRTKLYRPQVAIRTKARQFMDGLDLSNIDKDLSVYTRKSNAKLGTEEMGEGQSGYTMTKRDGSSFIIVNELERLERQRFSICHEVAHIVLGLKSDHKETPAVLCQARRERDCLRYLRIEAADALRRVQARCGPGRAVP